MLAALPATEAARMRQSLRDVFGPRPIKPETAIARAALAAALAENEARDFKTNWDLAQPREKLLMFNALPAGPEKEKFRKRHQSALFAANAAQP
jgi:hypothetical protein